MIIKFLRCLIVIYFPICLLFQYLHQGAIHLLFGAGMGQNGKNIFVPQK